MRCKAYGWKSIRGVEVTLVETYFVPSTAAVKPGYPERYPYTPASIGGMDLGGRFDNGAPDLRVSNNPANEGVGIAGMPRPIRGYILRRWAD
ncbi:MAG: hypothetical protein KJ970_07615 [Candidatus Eisenbacteria bacterium]|uniref:Uncharacterized protein n=1 Tax=Eiseniibacteriota bacterium TaxID=2212470 RepID=A0A948RWF5_UNCEI|nr:hypothetical protein [Candidatus Eisenbacteria bacterium]